MRYGIHVRALRLLSVVEGLIGQGIAFEVRPCVEGCLGADRDWIVTVEHAERGLLEEAAGLTVGMWISGGDRWWTMTPEERAAIE